MLAETDLLSVQEATQLLQLLNYYKGDDTYYQLQNVVAAACLEAWKLSIPMFGCGVCYHGNVGNAPYDVKYFTETKLRGWRTGQILYR